MYLTQFPCQAEEDTHRMLESLQLSGLTTRSG
jgi:hypothetical protein